VNLTGNIGQFKHRNSLVHFFLRGAKVLTLDSNEHYFRSYNRALPQDSHSLLGSTRDPWTVLSQYLPGSVKESKEKRPVPMFVGLILFMEEEKEETDTQKTNNMII
jgi:hypothetical protein